MVSNPVLMLLEGNGSLAGRDRNGAFSATGSGALRYAPAEGARTNWMHDPRGQSGALSSGWFGNITVASQAPGVRFTSHTTDSSFSYGVVYTLQRPALASLAGRQVWARAKVHGSGVIPSLQIKAWDPTYTISAGLDFDFWTIPTEPTVVVLGPITCMNDVVEIDAFRFGNGVAATDWWIELDEVMITTEDPTDWDFFDGASGGVWLDPITGVLGTAYASPSVSRAVFWVEEDTTNYFPNPVLENAATGGDQIGYAEGASVVVSRVVRWGRGASGYVVKCVTAASESTDEWQSTYMGSGTFAPGDVATVSLDVEMPLGVNFRIALVASAGNSGGAITIARQTSGAFVGTGKKQHVSFTGTAFPALTTTAWFAVYREGATVQTFYLGNFQFEKKAYETSLAVGNIGTGYTWASTAHASASARVGVDLYTPNGMVGLDQGSFVTRVHNQSGNGAGSRWFLGRGTYGTQDFIFMSLLGNVIFASLKRGAAGDHVTDYIAVPAGSWATTAMLWDTTMVRLYVEGTMTPAVPAPEAVVGSEGALQIGAYFGSQHANVGIGPVITYDEALSAEQLALADAAIDSNGGDDLWFALASAGGGDVMSVARFLCVAPGSLVGSSL